MKVVANVGSKQYDFYKKSSAALGEGIQLMSSQAIWILHFDP